MAHLPHVNKFLNYPPHFHDSRFSPHLPNFPLFRRRLSLFPTLCSSSNFLISTSVQSDGSLVFKFGDTSETPPVIENGGVSDTMSDHCGVSDTMSDDAEIKVELEIEIDDSSAVNDQVTISVSNAEDDVGANIESKYSAVNVQHSKQIVMESASDAVEVELGNIDLVVTSEMEYSVLSDGVTTGNDNDFSFEDSKLDVISEEDFHVENLDNEATLEDEESVKEMIIHDVVDGVFEEMELSSVQFEAALEDESVTEEIIKHDVDEVVEEVEVFSPQLEATLKDEETVDEGSVKEEMSKDDVGEVVEEMGVSFVRLAATLENEETVEEEFVKEMIKHDVDEVLEVVEEMEASSVLLEVETILDEERRNFKTFILSGISCCINSAISRGGDDAYFVCENWFGVADGIGHWSFGGIDKGLYAQEFIQNCERLARKNMNTGLSSFKELLQQSAAMTASSGAASILIAHIADQVLHVANIGDSGFIIVRNRNVFARSSPMCHEFNFPCAISSGDDPVEVVEEYHVELEEGDIIITATDGLFDNLYEHEIVYSVCKAVENGQNLKDLAELLALRSQEVGRSSSVKTPFADAAQAAGHPEFNGGKFDHVTVIVSAVQTE